MKTIEVTTPTGLKLTAEDHEESIRVSLIDYCIANNMPPTLSLTMIFSYSIYGERFVITAGGKYNHVLCYIDSLPFFMRRDSVLALTPNGKIESDIQLYDRIEINHHQQPFLLKRLALARPDEEAFLTAAIGKYDEWVKSEVDTIVARKDFRLTDVDNVKPVEHIHTLDDVIPLHVRPIEPTQRNVAYRARHGSGISSDFCKAILENIAFFPTLTEEEKGNLEEGVSCDSTCVFSDFPESIERHHLKLIEIIESGVDNDWEIKPIQGVVYYLQKDSSGVEYVANGNDFSTIYD